MSTLQDLFAQGQIRLSSLPQSERDALILLCESVPTTVESFHAFPEQAVSKDQKERFFSLIEKRREHCPLAYLTGKKEFWSLEFEVNPNVLIPRPETELLVELTLPLAQNAGTIVDVGTGSGNIAVSLAVELPKNKIVATDVSPEALETAIRNAATHKREEIVFCQGDLLSPLKEPRLEGWIDIILSNPPYVAESEWKGLPPEIQLYEPKGALVSGPTGLECIETLIEESLDYLRPGGYLLLEIGKGQEGKVREFFRDRWSEVSFFKDLFGVPRVVMAHRKE